VTRNLEEYSYEYLQYLVRKARQYWFDTDGQLFQNVSGLFRYCHGLQERSESQRIVDDTNDCVDGGSEPPPCRIQPCYSPARDSTTPPSPTKLPDHSGTCSRRDI
jgi:hypothetical protein